MNPEMRVIREVSMQAEGFYEDAVQLGNHAAHALKAAHRAQMTGLESIAESTLKTSDVFDYIKKQTARFPYWRQGYPGGEYQDVAFGERLKNYLEKDLATRRNSICGPKKLGISDETDEGKQERRRIYLLLMRQFIRQMVVQYEYQVNIGNKKRES
jgi:hypothetical protein